jgi:hypothetical protein
MESEQTIVEIEWLERIVCRSDAPVHWRLICYRLALEECLAANPLFTTLYCCFSNEKLEVPLPTCAAFPEYGGKKLPTVRYRVPVGVEGNYEARESPDRQSNFNALVSDTE